MNKLNEPAQPASGKETITAKLRIEGLKPCDARKAYRVWGRACKAITDILRPDYGPQINVVIVMEAEL